MKKIVLMMVMLFTMSIYSFADDTTAAKVDNIEKYDLKINHRKLVSFLDLEEDQVDIVDMFVSELESGILFASSMETEKSRNKILANAVNKNIMCMRSILNNDQYRKYLRLINLTLVNRGFDTSIFDKEN